MCMRVHAYVCVCRRADGQSGGNRDHRTVLNGAFNFYTYFKPWVVEISVKVKSFVRYGMVSPPLPGVCLPGGVRVCLRVCVHAHMCAAL